MVGGGGGVMYVLYNVRILNVVIVVEITSIESAGHLDQVPTSPRLNVLPASRIE